MHASILGWSAIGTAALMICALFFFGVEVGQWKDSDDRLISILEKTDSTMTSISAPPSSLEGEDVYITAVTVEGNPDSVVVITRPKAGEDEDATIDRHFRKIEKVKERLRAAIENN